MKGRDVELVGRVWNTLNLIWFAMFFSVLAYTILGLFLKGYVGFSFGEETLTKIRTIFYILSLGTITYSVYARRSYLRKASGEKKMERALEVYKIALIVSLGISDFIGIFGFLLLLMGDRFYGFPLIITAGLTMLYHRPKRSEILSLRGSK